MFTAVQTMVGAAILVGIAIAFVILIKKELQ